MGKALIIAEKPSVASDIAKALGGFTKHDDYFESEQFVLSSAVGHLLEIAMPEDEEVKRGKWSFANLPAVPTKFALRPIEKTESRLKVLTKLLKRKDVDALINACDAGREGELIFRYIVQHSKVAHGVRRLWLQSMTPQSIRDGFAKLRTDQEMLGLADAARCRSESDWLVGINGTRAMTAFNSKAGGFQLTTVGRVQTPTLAIMVERESKIRAFKARTYFEVIGTFASNVGDAEYSGRWFDESFKKIEDDEHAKAERVWEQGKADALKARCDGKPGVVSEESKPTTQSPPLLYDLTSLQREANGRFGFSAKTTLSIAQALYEKHKVLTYPRTDSRALPEDYIPTVHATLLMLEGEGDVHTAYETFAREIRTNSWVKPNKRIFDNTKISDHFAIIPTTLAPKALSEIEQKLYDLVTKRFLAVFYPSAEFMQTTRITRIEGEPFKSEGKVLVKPGWLSVYGREVQGGDANLAKVDVSKPVQTNGIEVAENQTRPPARYNEATLLSAMEGAGKLVDDEELRAAMGAKGLGTPATRAATIEGLIYEKYVLRDGKELIPTAKAFSLMALLHGLGIPELFSPELTGEWEYKLGRMEKGEITRDAFMREIIDMTRRVVEQAKNYDADTIPGDYGSLSVPCPKCGGDVHENYKKFQCKKCDFGFWKILGGKQLEIVEAETLLSKREVGPLEGFRSRLGRPFVASLKLNDKLEVEFDWGQGNDDAAEAPDFTGQESVGECPKCHNRVYEQPNAYVCEKALGAGRTCDFRSGRMILDRPIEREQMVKLLASGTTDLIDKFISKRTKRAFKAFLVRDASGKIAFKFEERVAKAGKSAKGTKGEAADTAENESKESERVEKKATTKKSTVKKVATKKVATKKAATKKAIDKKTAE